jgi:hypothetical protein
MNAAKRIIFYGSLALISYLGAKLFRHANIPAVPAFTVTSAVLIVGLIILFRVWRQTWHTVSGIVTESTEKQKPNPERRRIIVHQVSYEYDVGGQRFSGASALEFDLTGYDREDEIRQLRQTYKPGAPIIVYYPRSAPAVSSLTRSVHLPVIIGGLIGVVLWIVTGYYFYVALTT